MHGGKGGVHVQGGRYTFLSVERSELDRNYAPSVCGWLYST